MDYLKKYNLSDFDVIEIISSIDDMDLNQLYVNYENIEETLGYLVSLGVVNIKDLIINKSYLLHERFSDVKEKIEKLDISDLVNQINDDASLCDLI